MSDEADLRLRSSAKRLMRPCQLSGWHWLMLLSSAKRARAPARAVYCLWISTYSIKWSLFLDLTCIVPTKKWRYHTAQKDLLREALGRAVIIILIEIMVWIDSARKDDSNGCHIVFWSKIEFGCEIPAAKPNLLVGLVTFLTCFWPDRLNKSRPIGLIIPLIDRTHSQLSKTTLIAVIGQVGDKISAIVNFECLLHWAGVGDFLMRQSVPLDAAQLSKWRCPSENLIRKILMGLMIEKNATMMSDVTSPVHLYNYTINNN